MKPENLIKKRFIVEHEKTKPSKPNKKLLAQIKSRSVGFLTKEEEHARKLYLDEFREYIRYNDE